MSLNVHVQPVQPGNNNPLVNPNPNPNPNPQANPNPLPVINNNLGNPRVDLVPEEPPEVCNTKFRVYYSANDFRDYEITDPAQIREYNEQYARLEAIPRAVFGVADADRQNFQFDWSTMNISWLDATGNMKTFGLLDGEYAQAGLLNADQAETAKNLVIQSVQKMSAIAKKTLSKCSVYIPDISGEKWKEHCHATSLSYTPAIQRHSHESLSKLPTDFIGSAKHALKLFSTYNADVAEQEKALRRMAASHHALMPHRKMIKEQIVTCNALIEERNQELIDPAFPDKDAIKRAIKAQEDKIRELSKFYIWDAPSVHIAAAFTPDVSGIDPEDPANHPNLLALANTRADAAYDAMKKDQEYSVQTWADWKPSDVWSRLPDWKPLSFMRGTSEFDEKLKEYCVDTAARVFNCLPPVLARKAKHEFCLKHQLSAKTHSVEDDSMHWANSGAVADQVERHPKMKKLKEVFPQQTDTTLQVVKTTDSAFDDANTKITEINAHVFNATSTTNEKKVEEFNTTFTFD